MCRLTSCLLSHLLSLSYKLRYAAHTSQTLNFCCWTDEEGKVLRYFSWIGRNHRTKREVYLKWRMYKHGTYRDIPHSGCAGNKDWHLLGWSVVCIITLHVYQNVSCFCHPLACSNNKGSDLWSSIVCFKCDRLVKLRYSKDSTCHAVYVRLHKTEWAHIICTSQQIYFKTRATVESSVKAADWPGLKALWWSYMHKE